MQISKELDIIVSYAKEEAMRTGDYLISPDHLFLGMLRHSDNRACSILEGLDANLDAMKRSVEQQLFREQSVPYSREDDVTLGREAQNCLSTAFFEAISENADEVGPVHLLLALSRCRESLCRALFESLDIDAPTIKAYCRDNGLSSKVEPEMATQVRILGTISIKPSETYS